MHNAEEGRGRLLFQKLSFAKGADEAERRKEIVRNVNRHDFKRVIE